MHRIELEIALIVAAYMAGVFTSKLVKAFAGKELADGKRLTSEEFEKLKGKL